MSVSKKDVVVLLGCAVLLLATLGAVGSSGRRRAKEAVCLSNLRQWGTAFGMFAEDNEGYLCGYDSGGSEHGWPVALFPYYGQPNLRFCPEAVRTWTEGPPADSPFPAWGAFNPCGWWSEGPCLDLYGSYGMNEWAGDVKPELGAAFGGWDKFWRRVPVKNFMGGFPEYFDDPPPYDGYFDMGGGDTSRFCMNRHSGCVSSVFLDFSARKVGLKELWTLKWHRQYNTEGPWTRAGGVEPPDWPEWMQDFEDY
jgi:hypothetical protein